MYKELGGKTHRNPFCCNRIWTITTATRCYPQQLASFPATLSQCIIFPIQKHLEISISCSNSPTTTENNQSINQCPHSLGNIHYLSSKVISLKVRAFAFCLLSASSGTSNICFFEYTHKRFLQQT